MKTFVVVRIRQKQYTCFQSRSNNQTMSYLIRYLPTKRLLKASVTLVESNADVSMNE